MRNNLKHLPKHDNGRPDFRYTINREFIGFAKKMHVARFCGDYVGYADTVQGAAEKAREHQQMRFRAM